MKDVPALDIAIRGRWTSHKSLEHYLKNGRHWLSRIQVNPSSRTRLDEFIAVAATFGRTARSEPVS